MSVRTYVTTVGKETAEKWRDMIVKFNRTAARTTIRRYAKDMLAGDWVNTGVPIVRRASDGKIIDGGHRIHAVLLAAKTNPDIEVEFTIAENVPDDAFAVLDIGRGRSARDMLVTGSEGRSNGQAAAVVTWVWKFQHGNKLNASGSNVNLPTRREIQALYASDAERFETSAARGADAQRKKVGLLRVCGTFHYLARTTLAECYEDEAMADDIVETFYEKFLTGAVGSEDPGHPILLLRDRFISRGFPQRSAADRRRTYKDYEQLWFFFRAWEAWQKGEILNRFILPKNGITNENFPDLYLP